MISPIFEQLSGKYAGKMSFLKVSRGLLMAEQF